MDVYGNYVLHPLCFFAPFNFRKYLLVCTIWNDSRLQVHVRFKKAMCLKKKEVVPI